MKKIIFLLFLLSAPVLSAMYCPYEGRFLNRDPIEEKGGANLYGMVGNDPVNKWDELGQRGFDTSGITPGISIISENGRRVYTTFMTGDCSEKSLGSPKIINLTISICSGFCVKVILEQKIKTVPCLRCAGNNSVVTGSKVEFEQYFYYSFSLSCCVKGKGEKIDSFVSGGGST
jgi:hypothetical protein